MSIRVAAPLAFTLFLVIAFTGRRLLPPSVGQFWPLVAGVIALGVMVVLGAILRARR